MWICVGLRFTVGVEAALGKVRPPAAVVRGDQVHGQIEDILADRLAGVVEQFPALNASVNSRSEPNS